MDIVNYYWTNISNLFEKDLKDGVKHTHMLANLLQSGYPRLLRGLRDMFGRLGFSFQSESRYMFPDINLFSLLLGK